jgi:hypothetical protein
MFDEYLATTFSHSVDYLLTLVIVSFVGQKLFNLLQFHLSMLALISLGIGVVYTKSLLMPVS